MVVRDDDWCEACAVLSWVAEVEWYTETYILRIINRWCSFMMGDGGAPTSSSSAA